MCWCNIILVSTIRINKHHIGFGLQSLSHYKDQAAMRPSYLCNWNPCAGKMPPLYLKRNSCFCMYAYTHMCVYMFVCCAYNVLYLAALYIPSGYHHQSHCPEANIICHLKTSSKYIVMRLKQFSNAFIHCIRTCSENCLWSTSRNAWSLWLGVN